MRVLDRESCTRSFEPATLSYRPPLDWDRLLGFLAARATSGVELVDAHGYARVIRIDGHSGVVRVTRERPGGAQTDNAVLPVLHLEVSATLMPVFMQVRERVRQLFDLDAEPATIEAQIANGGLGPIHTMRPGLRVPGAFDGFELAVRAILGQQVSVKGATTLMSRLTTTFGEAFDTDQPGLSRLTATAEQIADAGPSRVKAIGLPASRAMTIYSLAREVAANTLRIEPDADVRALTRQMTDIPGIGPWTAEYVAMRALHWPDAFPATDLVLRRNAGILTSAQMLKAAERWRPWRAYAAMQLWAQAPG